MKPFRWDISRTEQLGKLTVGERSESYSGFIDELQTCVSRTLSFSEDGYLVFVGRSPESLFDYLSGLLCKTAKSNHIVHLNISNRETSILDIKKNNPDSYRALLLHFEECLISPNHILSRTKRTYFLNLVHSGGTFGNIAEFLFSWAQDEHINLKSFRDKIGFLGITMRTKNSPNTWRWQQNVEWVNRLGIKHIKNISAPRSLWEYLGNTQDKVSKSNRPISWNSESMLDPPREESNMMALRRAFDLYSRGKDEKFMLSKILAKEKSNNEEWIRKLILELRNNVQ